MSELELLHALAVLSTTIKDYRRTNFFAFDYPNLNCVRLLMSCFNIDHDSHRNDQGDIEFRCYNDYTANHLNYSTGPVYKMQYENSTKGLKLKLNPAEQWIYSRCPEFLDEINFDYVITYEPKKYFAVWGCGMLNKTHHEMGMWIFGGPFANTTEILDTVTDLYQLDSQMFVVNNFSNECDCKIVVHDEACFTAYPKFEQRTVDPKDSVLTTTPSPTIDGKIRSFVAENWELGALIGIILLPFITIIIVCCKRTLNRTSPH